MLLLQMPGPGSNNPVNINCESICSRMRVFPARSLLGGKLFPRVGGARYPMSHRLRSLQRAKAGRCTLGLDIGTQGTKAVLFDVDSGLILAKSSESYG